jgi:aerobic carbon-monoxide dehydrogenase medium subunit
VKPARFSYFAPTTAGDVVELLATSEDPKILAGGQSLVPAMNFRLARPATLIDVNRVAGLDGVETRDGHLRIGALVRHRRFERPPVEGPLGWMISQMARSVGHLPIRVRGTFGGSLAHADPAAEWCLLLTAIDGVVVARGPDGERQIPASSFFQTVFTTDLRPDELLVEARLPMLGDDHRVGFSEFSRRAGDFALVMAAAVLRLDGDGTVAAAGLGVGGAADRPVRAPDAEAQLVGNRLTDEVIGRAAEAAADSVRTLEDIHASAEYRRDLVRVMTKRALVQASGERAPITGDRVGSPT